VQALKQFSFVHEALEGESPTVSNCLKILSLLDININGGKSSVFFGFDSGSSTADASLLAKMTVPEMVRNGYPAPFCCAVIASSAVLPNVIPPSIAMLLFASIANVSVNKNAVDWIAAEDDRFYQHSGVDYAGLARAALSNVTSGRRGQGGSTITMQIARTFYLPSDKLYTRKIYEIALAFKIEAELSKDRIFEVYFNQIFLGNRAYGFGAAAQTYFGKRPADLSVAQMAALAGIPVAPSAFNPRANPKRAKVRQQYEIGRAHV
jgi:hypothetical protein